MDSLQTARWTLIVVCALATVLLFSMMLAGMKAPMSVPVVIDDCALVLTNNGHEQECR